MNLKDIILIIINITLAVIILSIYFSNKSTFGDNFDDRIDKLKYFTYYFIKVKYPDLGVTTETVTAEHAAMFLQFQLSDIPLYLSDNEKQTQRKSIIRNFFLGLPVKIITIIADTYIYQLGVSEAIRQLVTKQVQADGGWNPPKIDAVLSKLGIGITDAGRAKTFVITIAFLYTMYRARLYAKYYSDMRSGIGSVWQWFSLQLNAKKMTGEEYVPPAQDGGYEVLAETAEDPAVINEFAAEMREEIAETLEYLTDILGEEDAISVISESMKSAVSEIDEAASVADDAAVAEGGANPLADVAAGMLDTLVGIELFESFVLSEFKYCSCEAPTLDKNPIPVCYKGTCSEEFGGNYRKESAGLCAFDCKKKYGHCYYSNGTLCMRRDEDGCWEKDLSRPLEDRSRLSRPARRNEDTCNWDQNNLSNACRLGYSNICKDLRYKVSIKDMYQVLKQNNLIYSN